MSEPEKVFVHSPYVPYDPGVALYDTEGWNGGGDAEAWEYTGWRDEVMSWKESCYIHGHLNPSPTYVLRGPDALRFLTDFCVNSFAKFPVGSSKHAIMCNDEGNIMVHGMLLRLGDEEFISYWLSPWLPYLLMKHGEGYDVQGEDLTGQVFLFQIAGPRSLEVLEAASGDNLHDIRFLRHRPSTVTGATSTSSGSAWPGRSPTSCTARWRTRCPSTARCSRRARRTASSASGSARTCSTTPRTASRSPTTTSPSPGGRTRSSSAS